METRGAIGKTEAGRQVETKLRLSSYCIASHSTVTVVD
jgi:hypothetical protein